MTSVLAIVIKVSMYSPAPIHPLTIHIEIFLYYHMHTLTHATLLALLFLFCQENTISESSHLFPAFPLHFAVLAFFLLSLLVGERFWSRGNSFVSPCGKRSLIETETQLENEIYKSFIYLFIYFLAQEDAKATLTFTSKLTEVNSLFCDDVEIWVRPTEVISTENLSAQSSWTWIWKFFFSPLLFVFYRI